MHRRALLKTMGIALPAAALSSQLPTVAAGKQPDHDQSHRRPQQPVQTTLADCQPVADALGRSGTLNGGIV